MRGAAGRGGGCRGQVPDCQIVLHLCCKVKCDPRLARVHVGLGDW